MKGKLVLLVGPILFLLVQAIPGLAPLQLKVIGIMLWMLAWWISNQLPLGITALLPLIMFPILGVMDAKSIGALYGHPIIFLFLGGFAIGLAMEKWNLHRRIALNIVKWNGDSPSKILLGIMTAAALLSMWISNTATTVMMLPIGLSIIKLYESLPNQQKAAQSMAIPLFLGMAYAANIGGMSTLIGTPPNLVLASMSSEQGYPELSFSKWLAFALPLSMSLFLVCYGLLSRWLFRLERRPIDGLRTLILAQVNALGGMKSGEKRVAWLLTCTALLWIFRGLLNRVPGLENLSDTNIAIIAMISLFIVPAGKKAESLLVRRDISHLPWNIVLLFGGGLSLAKAMEISEVVLLVRTIIEGSNFQSLLLITLIITLFSIFLTEVMSNVALVSVFIPVVFIISENLGFDHYALAIPLTLGASCAFMLPIATPPNAIAFSSNYLRVKDMTKAGLILNLVAWLLIALYSYWLLPYFSF